MDGSLVFNYQRCGVTNSGRWACTLGDYMNTQNGDGGYLKFSYTCILNGSRTSLGSDNSGDLSFDFGGIMCDKVELKVPFYISDNKWQHYDKTFYINELYFY